MMKKTTNQLLRRNRSIQTKNFLEKLSRRGLGTNKAEHVARSIAKDSSSKTRDKREKLRKKLLHQIMKAKVEDADEAAKSENFKYHQLKKEMKKMIPNYITQQRLQQLCLTEAKILWTKQREKFEDKIKHLEGKHNAKEENKDTIQGVKVSDKSLGPTKPLPEPSTHNVDKKDISKNVMEVLKLHPKLAVHNPIKLVEVKTEIQKGFYKQRLNMKSEED